MDAGLGVQSGSGERWGKGKGGIVGDSCIRAEWKCPSPVQDAGPGLWRMRGASATSRELRDVTGCLMETREGGRAHETGLQD